MKRNTIQPYLEAGFYWTISHLWIYFPKGSRYRSKVMQNQIHYRTIHLEFTNYIH